jgi:hypothetical protein
VRFYKQAGSVEALVSRERPDRCTDRRLLEGVWQPSWRAAVRCLLALAGALLAAPAGATTADDICAATVDPCRVTQNINVTPASIIDFGTRKLVIANHGTLNLTGGTMAITAAEITVESGGSLQARGSTSTTGGRINLTANAITISGGVDATGAPGGAVSMTSTGTLMIAGPIDVRSRAGDNGGGSADLTGVNITIAATGRINALGGADDFGGDIEVDAKASLTLLGELNASGGDGGSIDLDSMGTMVVGSGVAIGADATTGGSSGGDIILRATGSLAMDGEISASGRNGSADIGAGDGGTISLEGGSINVSQTSARVQASAGTPDGVGGDVDVSSTAGAIACAGRIEALGPGVDGNGGGVTFDAIGSISISGDVGVGAGRGGAGEIDVSATGDVEIATGAMLAADATSNGSGGDIGVDSDGTLRILGELIADGGPTQGAIGGTITLEACAVRLETSGRLSSLRSNGSNTVTGRDLAVIAGAMHADPSNGRNVFHFAGPEYAPAIVAGSQIVPPAALMEDISIVPCNPVDTRTPPLSRSPTAMRTPPATRSTSPGRTSTPTRDDELGTDRNGDPHAVAAPANSDCHPTPFVCVGDCNGGDTVTISELITCVNISLGTRPLSSCRACDGDGNGMVGVNELVRAVNNSLNGCP